MTKDKGQRTNDKGMTNTLSLKRLLPRLMPFVILWTALALQTGYLVELQHRFPDSFNSQPLCGVDAQAHLARAMGLLDGSLPGDQSYQFIPLYPFYLAFLRAVWGDSLIFPIFMQILFQMAGLAALYGIGRLVFSRLTGLLAALGLAAYQYYHFYVACYDQVLLTAPFLTLAVFLLLKYQQAQKSRWLLSAGLMLALAAMSRPTLLALFPAIGLWLLWLKGKLWPALKAGLLLVGPFLILVSPITWHNYRVAGRFILLSDNFGVNIFTGNNPDAQGLDSLAQAQSQPAVIRYIDINEAVKAGQTTLPAEVLRYIREQPADWLALTAKKAWLWFGEVDERLVSPYFPLAVAQSQVLGLLPVEWQALAIVALLGILLASPEARSRRGLLLLWLIYGALSLATIIFLIQLRFRLPFIPFALLSAASLLALSPKWRRQQPRRFRAALVILLLLYPLAPGLGLFVILFVGLGELGNHLSNNTGRQQAAPRYLAGRSLSHYLLLALIALYLAAIGVWLRAERLASDVSQSIDHYLGPPLAGSGIIGQTFQMDCNGLHRVEVTLGLLGEQHDQPVTFYLTAGPETGDILFSETFEGRQVEDYRRKIFTFPPIPDSAGQTYFFFLASPGSTPQNAITARGYTDTPVDYYPPGNSLAGQPGSLQPLQADVAFAAYCDLSLWQKLRAVFEDSSRPPGHK